LLPQVPLDALRLALDPSTARPIDVALVNGEVFMNLATAGPVSEVSSKSMSDTSKKLLGPAAVAVAGERGPFCWLQGVVSDMSCILIR
jgi:diacylglycerol kinase family enzyme